MKRWESYLHESCVTYEKSYSSSLYADQRGNKYEQFWQYQSADGSSTWLYSSHFQQNDSNRLVLFLWSDRPDALGRRPIYHAKDMDGGGYGWAVVRYADSYAEELVTVLVDGGFARYSDPQTGNGFSALLLAEPTTLHILDDPSDGAAILEWTVDYTNSAGTAHSDTLAADRETGCSEDLAIQGYDDYAADNKTVTVTGTQEDIPDYTLSFVTDTDESLEPITAPAGTPITLPVPSYEGHSFVGWFRDENFWVPFNETAMPAENLTLYAKWAELPILIQGAVVTEDPSGEPGYDLTVPVSLPSGKSAEELKVTVAVYSAEGQLLELVFAQLAGG